MIRRIPVLLILLVACGLVAPRLAASQNFSWNIENCASGGLWTDISCWPDGLGYPNGPDTAVSIDLEDEGTILIPTATFLNITVNALTVGPKAGLVVGDNMSLVFSQSTTGADPTANFGGVVTVSSPVLGSASLRVGSPTQPDTTVKLIIDGSSEIRLGPNGGLLTETSTSIEMKGGIEIVSSASTGSPATINAELLNRGGEIRVLDGLLIMEGDVHNQDGGFVEVFDQSGSGSSALELRGILHGGRLFPGLGVVRMNGGELADIDIEPGSVEVMNTGRFGGGVRLDPATVVDVPPGRVLEMSNTATPGAASIHNDGEIHLGNAGGGATLRNLGSITEIRGTGTLYLDNPGSQFTTLGGGTIRNGVGHTIRGAGSIQCPVSNAGDIRIEGGAMFFFDTLSHMGGDVFVEGGASNPGIADIRASFSTRHLTVGPFGQIKVGAGQPVRVDGYYTIATSVETASSWSSGSSIIMRGGGAIQGFEAASTDEGATNGGFSLNFGIPRFVVGAAGTQVFLRDHIDNGNRVSGPEAVYVTVLEVLPGSTLNLNGICLYTKVGGVPTRVMAGDGALFGGGTILDDGSILTAVEESPTAAGLHDFRIAPNPYNARTTVRFQLEESGEVRVNIFDLKGRLVRKLRSGALPRGAHELTWDGRDDGGHELASGVYAVRIVTSAGTWTRSATLLK